MKWQEVTVAGSAVNFGVDLENYCKGSFKPGDYDLNQGPQSDP